MSKTNVQRRNFNHTQILQFSQFSCRASRGKHWACWCECAAIRWNYYQYELNVLSFVFWWNIASCWSLGRLYLLELEKYLFEKNAHLPIDIGSRQQSQIGGIVATNACGIRFIKNNNMHASVVGLKAVLANGEIFDSMTAIRKDQTGYDLKHNFIGSEGTLGIITEVALICV